MSEYSPPQNREQATSFEDGVEFDLHKSKLVSPEQGRALVEATREAETLVVPERVMRPHEQIAIIGHHVIAVRQAELNGVQELSQRANYDRAA